MLHTSAPNTVHLYICRLPLADQALYARLYTDASLARRERADRWARREDALRCLAGEALLRKALRCCGLQDDTVPQIGEHGKPYLDIDGFHYNISHGGDYVVLACGQGEIGVDVEPIAQSERRAALARRFFTPAEQELLLHDTDIDAATRFTVMWTRKESYVKFTGVGLSQGLQSFSVDVTLPRGHVADAAGNLLPLDTHTLITEDGHVISVCGAFDGVETEYVMV
jgi:4'-phosphopantetheinyl transferase